MNDVEDSEINVNNRLNINLSDKNLIFFLYKISDCRNSQAEYLPGGYIVDISR